MAIMRGVNCFLVARYIVFALFTICNAITCSVAVWNVSLVHNAQPAQVAVYLIVLGAFSLLSIFTLIFVELLCADPLTTRVWFECAWVAFFWLMELAGGAALVASETNLSCSTTSQPGAVCISERILLAFTWMCTITLLAYLLVVVFIATYRYVEVFNIWTANIRILGVEAIRQCPSSPNSPLTTRFKNRPSVGIYSPRPTRPQPVLAFPHGLGSEYEIEPFRPVFASPEQMDIPYLSDLPEATPLPPAPIIPSSVYTKPIPPLPKEARSSRPLSLSLRRELPSSVERQNASRPSEPVPGQSISLPLPSPSPLGDWPRQDVMQLPPKVKHRPPPPPSAFEFPNKQLASMGSTDRTPTSADRGTISTSVVQPRPRRPSGPRQRVPSGESGHRPAPLNLTGISSHGPGRHTDAG